MPKKYATTTTTLIIVESPAKCKKIEEYLGAGYKCMASYGHIRELPSLKNVDIENGFIPHYEPINNAIKNKNIKMLKLAVEAYDDVILATDDDREGEAIAWHLCEVLGLPIERTKRIVFHEITEHALREAIQKPTTINMNLVRAQQARQILDLLVGFKISPVLWKRITYNKENALSAGRCQTPALRLIYENELELEKAKQEWENGGLIKYTIKGIFTTKKLEFELSRSLDNANQVTDFMRKSLSTNYEHKYGCSSPNEFVQKPPQPFTTSRIQQVASNELRLSPKETMSLCQKLYENGYITYMRTDSKLYSSKFIEKVNEYVRRRFGENYVGADGGTIPKKNAKQKLNAQEAHEAIRPTNLSLEELPDKSKNGANSPKEKRLYALIWRNSVESCMNDARGVYIIASVSSPLPDAFYKYRSDHILFPGWKALTPSKFSLTNPEYNCLKMLGDTNPAPNLPTLCAGKISATATIPSWGTHYTEAKLVSALEEKGIGRPSTFASLVDKIQERGYVKKEDVNGVQVTCTDFVLDEQNGVTEPLAKPCLREVGNEKGKLVLQPMGRVVMEILLADYLPLFEYDYTSNMETELDKIAKLPLVGDDNCREQMNSLCTACCGQIDCLLNVAKTENKDAKLEYKIDNNHTYLIGKYGPVIKRVVTKDGTEETSFLTAKKNIDILSLREDENAYPLEYFLECNDDDNNASGDIHEETNEGELTKLKIGKLDNKEIVLKTGKYGNYATWNKKNYSLKTLGERSLKTISLEEVEHIIHNANTTGDPNILRKISDKATLRKGPKGDYIFYKSERMKKPKFIGLSKFSKETQLDYNVCEIEDIKNWLKNTHNIYA